MLFFMPVM